MRIGIDILGGDFAPQAPLDGVCLALAELDASVRLVLIGDQEQIASLLKATVLFIFWIRQNTLPQR